VSQLLQHYDGTGSASPEWIREMRAIEADCGLVEPLGPGPMEPEPAPVDPALFEDDKFSYLKDEALAERRELARMDLYDELGMDLR
jgi:hypothetical protein